MILSILKWWLIAQGLGWAALPITRRVFAWLPDRGYAFSKVVGLLLVSYLLWIGASGGLLENTTGGIVLAVGLVAGLGLWLKLRASPSRAWKESFSFWWQRRGHILRVDVLFLLAFVGWALVRAYAPSKIVYAYGEKFMEFAFLNGVLRSPTFPPLDPWLAGYAISYYYFGYVMMALVSRLAGTTPGVSFDLYDALLFALTLSAAYGLVVNLVLANRGKARAAAGFGLLGAVFVGGMGNLEGVIHALHSARLLPETFLRWLAIPDLMTDPQSGSLYPGHDFYQWWWWRASRVLNDVNLGHQDIGAQPITEFPFFSFLLGDNHPHKLALPFVLLAIGLAFNLLLRQTRQAREAGRLVGIPRQTARMRVEEPNPQPLPETGRGARTQRMRSPSSPFLRREGGQGVRFLAMQLPTRQRESAGWRTAGLGRWLFYALALGGLGFLNTWDFPIYLGLTLLAYTAGNYWARGRFTRADLLRTLGLGAGLGATSILLYLLFYLSFSSQASGVLPYIFPPTRLVQFGVMFGPFLFLSGFFVVGLALAAFRTHGLSLASGLRQVGRIWLWITAASYGPYLLVVGLAMAVLASGRLALDEAVSGQIQEWMSGMAPGEAFGSILFERLINPWTFLTVSLLMAVGIAAVFVGAARPPAGGPAAGSTGSQAQAIPRQISPAALFAALLAITGWLLALSVEFFYLRDSFGLRMNTVFKFYFQAWVMLAAASAFGVWWFWQHAPAGRGARLTLAAGAALLTAAGLVYSGMGIVGRTHAFSYPPNLDATATLAGQYGQHWSASPDDWAAIQWLQKQGSGAPILLEAPSSGSYNLRGRISAFTGLPTLLGWGGHEYQWRGSGDAAAARSPDIEAIFTTPHAQTALDLLQKWEVRYVLIGKMERDYVNEICSDPCNPAQALEKFEQVLVPVFNQGQTTIYQVPVRLP